MELINTIIIHATINSAIMVLVMMLAGTYFGISFGDLKPAVFKCMLILIATSAISVFLWPISILVNFIVWFLGLMTLFDLDTTEVVIFDICLNLFTVCIGGMLVALGIL
jgi:hypothetical protein